MAAGLLDEFIASYPPVLIRPEMSRNALDNINSDLHPKDEFAVPEHR